MSSPGLLAPLAEHRARLLPLGVALTLTYGYFVGQPAWNQNSRLALTRALVEQRTTVIDRYHVTTGDKSYRDGHFYCDKAPGASWLATVPYALLYGLRRVTGGELPDVRVRPLDPQGSVPEPDARQPGDALVYNLAHRIALYLCGLLTGVLPTVAAAAAVFLLALRQAAGCPRTAVVVALTFALATPAFPYATVFYGHALCGCALLWAFALVALDDPEPAADLAAGRRPLWVGTLLGAAVVTEYPAAVPALMITGLALWRHGPSFGLRVVLGGIPWALALAAYHVAAFGHPLSTGYDFVYREEFAEGMRVRYGIHAPDPQALWQLLLGSYRGLFYLSPVLLLAAWGLWPRASLRGRADEDPGQGLPRPAMHTALAIVAFYLLLNAGYYMWDGGAAYGPRHLVPMLGLLMLGAGAGWRISPRLFVVLAAVGGLHMVLGAAATPEAPQHGNPVWEYAWPRARGAEAAVPGRATNLGLLLGLPGLLSLVPLLAPWLWATAAAFKTGREG
ncbi:MAG: hypothetical protein AAGF11_07155 [Myxococcota bacterium]